MDAFKLLPKIAFGPALTDDLHPAAPGDCVEERGLGGDLAAVLPGTPQVQPTQDHLVLVRHARLERSKETLLSRIQARPGRKVKQEQDEISPSQVRTCS